ncbi:MULTISPECIES: DNA-J related domain-containing protein [unclassified Pseudoalteromonas]|uniref:DNA-J related domain-containing protein n=1 Tax=unclassified Pseudoalteromonas TaxID=194690 RepID=UPI000FFE79D5|nr:MULTISPECIES: DNA-J related domain-containing protein [unclassified Pseudoalteromonas]MCG9758209.1 molecular chaperone DnaJ [Pseudoalteromonas sp. Isolate6]RXE89367.1 molecular chaperone DnaJ [Pseudoalteromonas sp. A757]
MFNPLTDVIFRLICQNQSLKVHTIAAALMEQQQLPRLDEDENKNLFKRNFLIMNALYQLQQEVFAEGQYLHVEALNIYLSPHSGEHQLALDDPLRSYYLDWQHYETSGEEVSALLDNFWQHFAFNGARRQIDIKADELNAIKTRWRLPNSYDRRVLSQCWRKLALTHHPDKSGDEETFKRLMNEYEILKQTLST